MNRTEVIQALAEEIAEEMIEHLEKLEPLTNGDIVKAVFPNLKYTRGDGFTMIEADNHATRILIWDSFWDSPYMAESEDNED